MKSSMSAALEMKPRHYAALCSLALCLSSGSASAHIKMLKPASWVTTDAVGNPQKAGPCGTASPGSAATGAITEFKAGEEITVEWTETVDHPGHFRIALAKDRAELEDPDLMPAPGGCDYPAGSVPTEPHGNVLLDNLYPTTSFGGTMSFSQKVKLPNEPCEKCTLQLIQWMTVHPPSCLYYQCADIKIVAAGGATAGTGGAAAAGSGAAGAGTAGAAAAGSGAAGTTAAAAGSGGARAGAGAAGTPGTAGTPAVGAGGLAGTRASGAPAAGGAPGTAGAGTMTNPVGAAGAATPTAPVASSDSGGCSVQQPGRAGSPFGWASAMLGLALLMRRRKR